MKKRTLVTLVVIYGVGVLCTTCGYIAGHTTAMHQHGSDADIESMILNNNGKINYIKYIRKAFGDYTKMIRDPYKTLN